MLQDLVTNLDDWMYCKNKLVDHTNQRRKESGIGCETECQFPEDLYLRSDSNASNSSGPHSGLGVLMAAFTPLVLGKKVSSSSTGMAGASLRER